MTQKFKRAVKAYSLLTYLVLIVGFVGSLMFNDGILKLCFSSAINVGIVLGGLLFFTIPSRTIKNSTIILIAAQATAIIGKVVLNYETSNIGIAVYTVSQAFSFASIICLVINYIAFKKACLEKATHLNIIIITKEYIEKNDCEESKEEIQSNSKEQQ